MTETTLTQFTKNLQEHRNLWPFHNKKSPWLMNSNPFKSRTFPGSTYRSLNPNAAETVVSEFCSKFSWTRAKM